MYSEICAIDDHWYDGRAMQQSGSASPYNVSRAEEDDDDHDDKNDHNLQFMFTVVEASACLETVYC